MKRRWNWRVFRQYGSFSCISVQQSFLTHAVRWDRAYSLKVKGVPPRAMKNVFVPKRSLVLFVGYFLSVCQVVGDASLAPPSWERGQDCSLHWYWLGTRWTWGLPETCSSEWTPRIHTDPSWRGCSPSLQGTCERGSVNRRAWECLLTAWWAPPCVQPFTGNVTCAPGSSVLFPLRPLGVRVEAYLYWQQLCAGETPPEGEHKSAICHCRSQDR